MARPKKDSRPVTIRMEHGIFDRMENFCERSGQPKTVAIERALAEYIDKYDQERKLLAESKQL